MADRYLNSGSPTSMPELWKDLGNGAWARTVAIVGTGGGDDAPDRELIVQLYRAKNAFTGASVGDLISSTRIIDVAGASPSQVGATQWYNETTQLALAGAPLAANIELAAGTGGATNAEMTVLFGAKTTESPALPAGGSGVVGWLSNLFFGFFGTASAAADAGNPVKVGAVYNSTPPTFTSTHRVNLQADDRGSLNTTNIKQPLVSRQLAAGAASAATQLTTTCRRISIYARGGDVRYLLSSATGTALTTSHFIAQGERLDIAVPATPWLMVLRGGVADCTLEVSELS